MTLAQRLHTRAVIKNSGNALAHHSVATNTHNVLRSPPSYYIFTLQSTCAECLNTVVAILGAHCLVQVFKDPETRKAERPRRSMRCSWRGKTCPLVHIYYSRRVEIGEFCPQVTRQGKCQPDSLLFFFPIASL